MLSLFSLYDRLVGLYPQPYREKYAGQMVQTLADMLDAQPTKTAKAAVWLRASLDLSVGIAQQNLIYIGGIATHQTPHYVKRNSLISTVLVVPFFAIVFSKAWQHNSIANSDVFQSSLYLTFIVFPVIAFIVAAATLVRWSRQDKKSLWRRLIDIRRSWILVPIAVLALGISLLVPFHDSVHCIVGNPIRIVHNPHQTWQCISDGFLGGK